MEHCVVSGYLSDLPMISVIVPAYNIEQYLPRCLDSLVNQTYKNLEILLVDDGSVDLSGIICNKYAADDSRIRVFHIKNGGVSNARNFALDNMHGEYVTFVDSDDWLDVDWVEQAFYKVKDANVLLIEGKKNGNPGLKILPPLYTHNEDGSYSDEVKKFFENN